jgi:putative heme d1 biosynthesis radical SAM protein NirJ1
MISLTRLLTNQEYFGDHLRYQPTSYRQTHGASLGYGPVVVWNITRSCNLGCIHCYANAVCGKNKNELTFAESKKFIDDLADFKVPVLLFSGGEPLIREDIFELIQYAASRGIRSTISTNGTLITQEIAVIIKASGVSYVGISLDGVGIKNDTFRGVSGAFGKALAGIRNCLAIGQRVGLRFTISKHTYESLNEIFDLIEQEKIPRVCFYHLVYSGRGIELKDADVTLEESRNALDLIIAKTFELERKGIKTEILTVDNHADGVYLYLWALKHMPDRADSILTLLRNNGGNRSGVAFGNVDWEGNVHPDQFTRDIILGNIRDRKFSEIWTDPSQPVLAGLRERKKLLEGRCSQCRWLELCNGNFRARATVLGSFWASDPACYLTDEEIGAGD